MLAQASHLPDEVFLRAASVLSSLVSDEERAAGMLFPAFSRILDVSKKMMVKVGAGKACPRRTSPLRASSAVPSARGSARNQTQLAV